MKRSDLKPGTVFVYLKPNGHRSYGAFYVDTKHPDMPNIPGGVCRSSRDSMMADRGVAILWSPPEPAKPKRSELKPGTVFRYLSGPSANWEMYAPKLEPHWYDPTRTVARPHREMPEKFKNAVASNPAAIDAGKEVEVLWEPPPKPVIVPPKKTPPVVNKGALAAKIANRPSLDGLENGLKQLDTAAQKLNAYPPTTSHPDFAKIGKWTGKPVDKKPPPLPTDDKARKALPVFTGPLMYFPHALLQIGAVCKAGNDQHNPGEPMHWAREKSTDQLNTALRHMMDHGLGNTKDTDGQYHLAKAAWRILAELQLTIERDLAGDNR